MKLVNVMQKHILKPVLRLFQGELGKTLRIKDEEERLYVMTAHKEYLSKITKPRGYKNV